MTGRWWMGALVAVVFGSGCSKKTTLDTGLRDYEGAPSVSDTDTGDETEPDDPETDTDTGVDTDTGEAPVVDDWDEDGFSVADGDCNDGDASVFPGATEVCNQRDDNCDGEVDEGIETTDWHEDYDADGYGSIEVIIAACAQPGGYVADGTDCDDWDAHVYPGAPEESGDDTDANCDGWLHDYRECVEDETVDAVMVWLATWHTAFSDLECDGTSGELHSYFCTLTEQNSMVRGLNVTVESTADPLVFETTIEALVFYDAVLIGTWDCDIKIENVEAVFSGTVSLDVGMTDIVAEVDFETSLSDTPSATAVLSGDRCPDSLDVLEETGVELASLVDWVISLVSTFLEAEIENRIELEFEFFLDCPIG